MSRTDAPIEFNRTKKPQPSSCDVKAELARLGLSQSEFAQLLGVSPRAVGMWAAGDIALPGPVAGYLRVLHRLSPDGRVREYARVDSRRRSLDDGFYQVRYSGRVQGESRSGQAYCVFRNGVIFGADIEGGVVEGSYAFEPGLGKTNARCIVRPADPLATVAASMGEIAPGPVEISGVFVRPAPHAKAKVNIGHGHIDVVLTFLGPIPE